VYRNQYFSLQFAEYYDFITSKPTNFSKIEILADFLQEGEFDSA
jgi:hypothetical protein